MKKKVERDKLNGEFSWRQNFEARSVLKTLTFLHRPNDIQFFIFFNATKFFFTLYSFIAKKEFSQTSGRTKNMLYTEVGLCEEEFTEVAT